MTVQRVAAAVMISAALLVGVPGCRSYRVGSLMHDQISTVRLASVVNGSEVPRLGAVVREALAESVVRDGSLRLLAVDADATLEAKVQSCGFQEAGHARRRAESDQDRDVYQTSVYQARVTLQVRLVMPGREKAVVDWRDVTGVAEFNRLPDMAEAQADALKLAAANAAAAGVRAITEAW